MAQVYFIDSGLMHINDFTKGEAQLRAMPDFDPGIMDTTNILGDFSDRDEKPYLYVDVVTDYFQRENGLHPYLCAVKTMYTALQWDAIELVIDEAGGIKEALDRLDVAAYSMRITALKDAGKITATDETNLLSVLP